MNAEIIAVGSELLLGQITNTNARFISGHLAELGINVYFHTVVGDNPERLEEVLTAAESRADLIILTGGLGPTKDDLTKETIARHLGTKLVMDEAALTSIVEFFKRVGRPMTNNNKKQALVLDGSTVLPNHHGMAPGMLFETAGRIYMLLPGPPKEMEPMFQFEGKPALARMLNKEGIIMSHVLRFYGIGEAELEDRIQDLLDAQTNPTIAPLASDGEVTLRISAKADSEEQAWTLIESAKRQLLERAGGHLYGFDDDSLASKTIELLESRKLTVAAAESLTAGLFMSELAAIPGASSVLKGGLITYSAKEKIRQLQVPEELLREYGAVSRECAQSMAEQVRVKFDSDYGIGLTGAAGPDEHDGKPAGTVWISIASADGTEAWKLDLPGMRNTNRLRAVKLTFHHLIQLLQKLPVS